MNVVIWLVCALFYGLVITGLSSCGISLGGIPTMLIAGLAMLTAKHMCQALDKKRTSTTRQEKAKRTEPDPDHVKSTQVRVEGNDALGHPRALSVLVIVLAAALILCVVLCCTLIYKLSSTRATIGSLEAELAAQQERCLDILNDAEESAMERLEKISDFSMSENIGFASNNFKADRSIIIVSLSDYPQEFTLTAFWEDGGNVAYSYDSTLSYPPASVSFVDETWASSTTVAVYPNYEGIVTITFSNDVNSDTFKILVIVTK